MLRYLADRLREEGYVASHETVRTHLRKLGLAAPPMFRGGHQYTILKAIRMGLVYVGGDWLAMGIRAGWEGRPPEGMPEALWQMVMREAMGARRLVRAIEALVPKLEREMGLGPYQARRFLHGVFFGARARYAEEALLPALREALAHRRFYGNGRDEGPADSDSAV